MPPYGAPGSSRSRCGAADLVACAVTGVISVMAGLGDQSLGVFGAGLGVVADVADSAVLIWRFRAERLWRFRAERLWRFRAERRHGAPSGIMELSSRHLGGMPWLSLRYRWLSSSRWLTPSAVSAAAWPVPRSGVTAP